MNINDGLQIKFFPAQYFTIRVNFITKHFIYRKEVTSELKITQQERKEDDGEEFTEIHDKETRPALNHGGLKILWYELRMKFVLKVSNIRQQLSGNIQNIYIHTRMLE